MARIWENYLDERDKKVYQKAGLGTKLGIGKKPALVIVDVQYGFTGDSPENIEESIQKYPTSCGETSWQAIDHIKLLLHAARNAGLPIFFTIIEGSKSSPNEHVGIKGDIFDHPALLEGEKGSQVVEELKPQHGEILISKKKPSIFFGTPLASYLTARHVDSLIITGCTTSGCVRASVIDAFSHNYKVVVPEECVFDRGIASHAINLFDMQQKYADVVPVEEVIKELQNK
ncbi:MULTISPECIES: isochorismatase family protein [unclassified Paenibacillus]|uniref:isochorismatase family protein n=1 Tax=unclassified Paenibacillus TaxID=185978 RepID=UPI001AEAD6A3|nr:MULTISPECIES: isochorismatase family protein [unclassified Paenibacillus]MBP1154478.1 nicotinamidase-related amidase [Paenibacillus sp. PvP091]MBP1170138.1 nicotinamidase-related amidase [Paenibacillus sp. PvR098]MBP2441166.1 nicotinamidase-related amidase [Paenibacillus sp. PvP052]